MSALNPYYYGHQFSEKTNSTLELVSGHLRPLYPDFVDRFYEVLLSDTSSSRFLDSDAVEDRLKTQLIAWLDSTLSAKSDDQVQDSIRLHQSVGAVHARAEIPMSLVDMGVTVLKEQVFKAIIQADLAEADVMDAVVTTNRLLDSARSVMHDSYMRGRVSHERTSQEFITASSAQELALEMERIKSSIYQWMTSNLISSNFTRSAFTKPLHKRDFGLWITHKLPLIVNDRHRLAQVKEALDSADSFRAQLVDSHDKTGEFLPKIAQALQELIWHLTEEANANLAKESKRDALTALFERRFLDPILQQETHMAVQGKSIYSVIMLDLDNFKRINDLYGHTVGDLALRETSRVVKESIRLTDYAFRYGGEEILIVAPELDHRPAVNLAERIRTGIADLNLQLSEGRTLNFTASLGVATFAGHPDYQRIINEADNKMYEAKNAGKNCVKY